MRITKEPEVRKKEIIDAAMALFEEKGIQKTSMSDIAKRLSVAKGLLYYYFKSKDELLSFVIDEFSKGVDETIEGIMENDDLGFHGKLGAIISLFFSSIAEHPAMMNISPGNPGVFDYIKTRLSDIAIHHAKVLMAEGEKEGFVSIRHPEYMLKILIGGIADLYVEGVTDQRIHRTLIEQVLGLEEGKILLQG